MSTAGAPDTGAGAAVLVARQVLVARRAARRVHGASTWQRLESLYTAALAAAILGSMALSETSNVLSGGSCSAGGRCLAAAGRPALALAVALVGTGLLLRAASVLGPVAATRAEAAWLLSTPADRRVLLRPALVRALGAAAGAGGVLGWLVLLAATPQLSLSAGLLAAVVTGAGALVAAVAAVSAAQSTSRGSQVATGLGWALVVAGAAAAIAALVPLDVVPALPVGSGLDSAAVTAGAPLVAVAVAAAAVVLAARRVTAVPLRELRGAGDVQGAIHSSVIALDARQAGDALDGRRRVRGRVRSRRGLGTGLLALALRDVSRLPRRPGVFAVAAGLLLVPALVLALTGPLLAVLVAVLLAIVVARSVAGGLRAVAGSSGLLRSFPFSTAQIRMALLAGPLLVTLVWSVAATATLGLVSDAVPVLALAGLAGAVRAIQATGSGSGPMVLTGAGPVPLGLLASVVRGPDVALVAAAPFLLGASPTLSVATPLLLLLLVVSIQGRRR